MVFNISDQWADIYADNSGHTHKYMFSLLESGQLMELLSHHLILTTEVRSLYYVSCLYYTKL